MGGGAMNIDFPIIQLRSTSSSNPPISSSYGSATSHSAVPLNQSRSTASSSSHQTCSSKKTESAIRREDKRPSGFSDISVFGSVPSKFEVENAISVLTNFMHEISSFGGDPTTLISQGYGRVCDTFLLLLTDPSIKRLVVSLASDKAIWDAVMNNELVRQLHESPNPGGQTRFLRSEEEPKLTSELLKWILNTAKAKIMELIAKFQGLMNEVLQPLDKKNSTEETRVEMDDKVRSSLLLSIVILLIVVVTRARRV